jgi:hypothetical protein
MNSSKDVESELEKLESLREKSDSVSTVAKPNILISNRINLADLKSQEAYLNRNYLDCLKYLVESCLIRFESHQDSLKLKQLTSDDFFSKFDQAVHFQQTSTLLLLNNDSMLRMLTSTQQLITDLPSNVSTNARNKSIYLNNLALLNFSLQKYHLSSYFLNKSLSENESFLKSEDFSSSNETMSHVNKLTNNSHNEILYNMGISLLFGKQPIAAFKCLYKVADVFNQNARLWLRLAECCIMCHQHSLVQNNSASTNNSSSTNADENEPTWQQTSKMNTSHQQQIPSNLTTSFNEKIFKLSEKVKCVNKSFGQSFHHKIQIGSSLSKELNTSLNYANYLSVSDLKNRKFDENFAKMLTLEFAFMCLKNALNLLPSNQQIFTMNRNNNDVFTYFSQLKSSSTSKLSQQETAGSGLPNDDQQAAGNNESAQSVNEQEQEQESTTSVDQAQTNNGGSPKQQMLSSTSSNELLNQHQLDNKLFNCVWPSKPINIVELQSLRSSILTSLAYVSLCLKDYTSAIKYSSMLLDTNDQFNSKYPISKGHRYLASSYLAEANLYLDKLNESIECLNQTVKLESENDISFVPPKLIELVQSTSNENKSLRIFFFIIFCEKLKNYFNEPQIEKKRVTHG